MKFFLRNENETMSGLLSSRASIKESLVTGAICAGASRYVNGLPLDAKQFGLSVASDYLAPTLTDRVPVLSGVAGVQGSDAVFSGALYTGATQFIQADPRSWMYRFLYQAGSSYVGGMVLPMLPSV
jgi:hypothetical protein